MQLILSIVNKLKNQGDEREKSVIREIDFSIFKFHCLFENLTYRFILKGSNKNSRKKEGRR